MPRLVSLVGTTPGVTHTGYCLLASAGVGVDEVVIVGNLGEVVDEAARILAECPCPWGEVGVPRVRRVYLGFPDIRSELDLDELGGMLSALLREGDYVDITGGRKIMSAWAAIVALKSRAHVVASIVPGEEIERARHASTLCGKTVSRAHLVRLA